MSRRRAAGDQLRREIIDLWHRHGCSLSLGRDGHRYCPPSRDYLAWVEDCEGVLRAEGAVPIRDRVQHEWWVTPQHAERLRQRTMLRDEHDCMEPLPERARDLLCYRLLRRRLPIEEVSDRLHLSPHQIKRILRPVDRMPYPPFGNLYSPWEVERLRTTPQYFRALARSKIAPAMLVIAAAACGGGARDAPRSGACSMTRTRSSQPMALPIDGERIAAQARQASVRLTTLQPFSRAARST